jgi:two-component system chemotaxis response regulator CheY
MPNMDGLELLSKGRAQHAWQSLPAVIVSTAGTHAKVREAVARSGSGHVRKRFTTEQIKQKLARLI